MKYMSVLRLRFRRKKRTNFFFSNRNFIAVQIFMRLVVHATEFDFLRQRSHLKI